MTRRRVLLCLFFIVQLSTASVPPPPPPHPILKEAIEEHLKDIHHDDSAESLKHDKHKEESLREVDSKLTDNHKNQYSKSTDEGKYVKKDHDTKAAAESDSYKGYNAKADKAEDSETQGFKRGHKKGHHKQGFQNSYHKDESSNKSTYFDDFNDEGDKAAYNSRLNSHNNQGGRSYHGSHNNGQEYVRDNYHGGAYNRHGELGNKHRDYQDHGRKYQVDDLEDHNKYRKDHASREKDNIRDYHEYKVPHQHHHVEPGWDWQKWDDRRRGWDDRGWDNGRRGWDDRKGWDDRRGWERPGWQNEGGWERDYGGPGYYDDRGLRHEGGYGYGPNHGYGYGYGESRTAPIAQVPKNAPVVAHRKQTITIYEDPRYNSNGKQTGQLRKEEGDYLQLEFKPSSQRYAQYDDTYYNAPIRDSRQGGVETSKINRLVYNYRRH